MNFLEYLEEGDENEKEVFVLRNAQSKFIPMRGKYPYTTKAFTHRKGKYQILNQIKNDKNWDLYFRVTDNLEVYEAIPWEVYENEHLSKNVKLKDMNFDNIPHKKKVDSQLKLFPDPWQPPD